MFDPRAVFLGPQGQNADLLERLTLDGLRDHVHWRRGFHPEDPDAVDPFRQLEPAHLQTRARFETWHRRLLARLKGSIPSHSPRYLAHMMGDTLLPAQVGYAAAMLYNPNNVATEGSPVTTELEREVAADLAGLLGFDPATAFGHLCGGGTVANLEALWILRNLALRPLTSGRPEDLGRLDAEALAALPPFAATPRPERPFAVLAPVTAHYSWIKAMDLLGLCREHLVPVAVDEGLRMDLGDLEAQLERLAAEDRPVLACVGVVGTTEGGGVDPVDGILEVRRRHRARHGRWFLLHLDAAYGGYARALLRNEDGSLRSLAQLREQLPQATEAFHRAFAALGEADSITVDPHKLGFVPYPAGALVLRLAAMREAIGCHAAYLNEADPSHLGSFILEGSKPGAAAAACWMAHRVVPLDHTGYGAILGESFRSAQGLAELLTHADFGGPRCEVLQPPDLDVLLYAFTPGGHPSLEAVNALNERMLQALPSTGEGPFALTSTWVRPEEHGPALAPFLARLGVDPAEWRPGAGLRLLRSALMTPFVADPEVKAFYRGKLVEALRAALA
ncbi:MAG TPA: pyridoxal-dependent decarboxylase [Holophagaceae bacterium]|nr:pyridoxal-dependent decarboxylase [Holophagaceae bacterium]